MSTQVLIMTFDRKQLDFILSNFELFSSDEVRVAAKQLVQKNKDLARQGDYERWLKAFDRSNDLAMADARSRGVLNYNDGFNQGFISGPLGLGRIF